MTPSKNPLPAFAIGDSPPSSVPPPLAPSPFSAPSPPPDPDPEPDESRLPLRPLNAQSESALRSRGERSSSFGPPPPRLLLACGSSLCVQSTRARSGGGKRLRSSGGGVLSSKRGSSVRLFRWSVGSSNNERRLCWLVEAS